MNEDSFAFTVYMIHEIANKKGKTPGQIYKALKDCDCIDEYLVPCFDVLHTMGTEYLIEDIDQYVSLRGGTL